MSIAVAAAIGGNGRLNGDSPCIGKGRLAQPTLNSRNGPANSRKLGLEIAKPMRRAPFSSLSSQTRWCFKCELPDSVGGC